MSVLNKPGSKEVQIIRDLAKKYSEACMSDKNLEKKNLWRAFNALEKTRTPFLLQYGHAAKEVYPVLPKPQTNAFADVETALNMRLWHFDNLEDDNVLDPWLTVEAKRETAPGFWGFDLDTIRDEASRGWRVIPAISAMEDLQKLRAAPHAVTDPDPERARQLREALDGVLSVHVNRGSVYSWWGGVDLSEAIYRLVGLEEFMVMMYDEPELLHRLLAFLRDGVLANLKKVGADGDWSTCNGYNHAVLYTKGLPEPKPNSYGASGRDLWFFMHGQEFEPVSPQQHEEFLLQYQMPIMELFGLIAYGCCESLDNKIDMLRKIPNLRRICVGPLSDLKKMAAQTGTDYIASWRPGSAMLNFDYDPGNNRSIIKKGIRDAAGSQMEIIIKDVMTFNGQPYRMAEFSRMCMGEILSQ